MDQNMDTKKAILWLAIILVTVLSLGAAVLAGAGIINLPERTGISSKAKFGHDVNDEKTLDLTDIKNIELKSTSTDINLITAESNEAKAHLYGSVSSSRQGYLPELIVEKSGNRLIVRVEWPNIINIGFFNSNLKLDVYIPKVYAENLILDTSSADIRFDHLSVKTFKCKTTSGNLAGNSLNADEIWLDTSSGDYKMDCKAEKFTFQSTSGDLTSGLIDAKEIDINTSSGTSKINTLSENFKFESTSGDLISESFKTGNADIETSSGTVKLFGVCENNFLFDSTSGDLTFEGLGGKKAVIGTSSGDTTLKGLTCDLEYKSTSGVLHAEYLTFDNDATIETSSGNVTLKLPENAGFYLDFKSSSGVIHLGDFPLTVKGTVKDHRVEGTVVSDKNRINISTSSGNVKFMK